MIQLIEGVLHFKYPASIGQLCVVVPNSQHAALLQEGHTPTVLQVAFLNYDYFASTW